MTKLDRIDFEILQALQKNARISNKELAAIIGLAPSSCHERLKRLNSEGVFRGVHLDVDPALLGYDLKAILMMEVAHESHDVDQFMSEVEDIPEVIDIALITGRYDLIVHVVVRDTNHLKNLAMAKFSNRPEIKRLETSIIYESRRTYHLPMIEEAAPA
ncbi:MAG: AsnC family transcriptional regulator [Hyphococcus sp.]|nr:MAG: AsnC family transcriptional regulator [Marinicaulis sp.]